MPKFQPKRGVSETVSFKSPPRFGKDTNADLPGPSHYKIEKPSKFKKEKGSNRPFGVNESRFKDEDNGVPGAGQYPHQSSIEVKNPQLKNAAFSSKLDQTKDMAHNKEFPGIGAYDT